MIKSPDRRPIAAAAVVVAMAACGGSEAGDGGPAAATLGPWTLGDAVVVFERRDATGSALHAYHRATASEARLTPTESRNWAGRTSPDGSRLAFVSSRDGDYEVYVVDYGGDEPTNLTGHPDYDIVGAWSPDGRRFAFMSTRGFELGGDDGPFPGHVYVVGIDGSGLRQVTRSPLTSSLGPTDWSPDGRWLTIARESDGQLDVFLLDVESGVERRVTSEPSSEYAATFSNDGTRLAFHAEDGVGSRIVVTALDGTERRPLTPADEVAYSPTWSPDDGWLLYTRRGDGIPEQYDVLAVRVADGVVEPLVATPADERGSDWGPVSPDR